MENYGIHERERERQALGNTVAPIGRGSIRGTSPIPSHVGLAKEARRPMASECKTADQRVAIAIDVQNLYYGAKDIYGTKVAYQKFLERALNGRKLVRSIAYIANRDSNNQGSFIKLMRGIGCDIRQKQVIERPNGMKCNWDVEIAVDAMSIAPRIDTFVLASGDGDFTYLLRSLKMQGVKTEVIAFRANTSSMLIDEADNYQDISRDMLIDNAQAWKNKPVSLADAGTSEPCRGVDDGVLVKKAAAKEDGEGKPDMDELGPDEDDEAGDGGEGDNYYEEPEYPENK